MEITDRTVGRDMSISMVLWHTARSRHTVMQPDRANVHAIDENLSRRRLQDAEQRKEQLSHKGQKEQ